MNRRDFLKSCALAAGGAVLSNSITKAAGLALSNNSLKMRIGPALPNIVFIMADDLGYGDLSCYGATKVTTPNIDRLAEEGMRFTDAHTPSAVCSPTRYGVLTGRYCWRTWHDTGGALPSNSKLLIDTNRMTVASMLKSIGYATGCVGKWHLGFGETEPDWNGKLKPGPLEVGFDYYFGVPTSNNWPPFVYVENHYVVDYPVRKDEEIGLVQTDKALKFIERSKDKPFFLYFPTCNVHHPYTPNNNFIGRSEAGSYGDFITELDWTVGEVVKTLDRLNLSENTLLIVTSDNGASGDAGAGYGHLPNGPLRGQKGDVWEGGHRVPFIARWPGVVSAGSTSDKTVCLTDLMMTCAAIVGEKLPNNAAEDSFSFLPYLQGKTHTGPVREAIVHYSVNAMSAIRKGKWKFIDGEGSGGWSLGGDGLAGQLYDMETDLGELNNLYDDIAYQDIVNELAALLQLYKDQGYSRPM